MLRRVTAKRSGRADADWAQKKTAGAAFFCLQFETYAENDDPQPQVEVAFGFLITNCAPSTFSW